MVPFQKQNDLPTGFELVRHHDCDPRTIMEREQEDSFLEGAMVSTSYQRREQKDSLETQEVKDRRRENCRLRGL